jgi:hypothetical protein
VREKPPRFFDDASMSVVHDNRESGPVFSYFFLRATFTSSAHATNALPTIPALVSHRNYHNHLPRMHAKNIPLAP